MPNVTVETARADSSGQPVPRGAVIHWAARYDALLWVLTLGREGAFREKLISLAHLDPGESVLDVGCGTGTLAILAKRRVGASGRVHGIDPSPEMIARAARKAGKSGADVAFQTAFVQALPFADAQFDVVLSTLMMHHLPRAARQECAREIRRVLKPSGRVLIVDFGERSGGKKSVIGHLHRHGHLQIDQVVTVVNDAGLSILESGPVGTRSLYFVLATPQGA